MLVLSIVSSNCPQNLGQSMYLPSNLVMTNFGSLAWIPMADSVRGRLGSKLLPGSVVGAPPHLYFEKRRGTFRGTRGHASPDNFEILESQKCYFLYLER